MFESSLMSALKHTHISTSTAPKHTVIIYLPACSGWLSSSIQSCSAADRALSGQYSHSSSRAQTTLYHSICDGTNLHTVSNNTLSMCDVHVMHVFSCLLKYLKKYILFLDPTGLKRKLYIYHCCFTLHFLLLYWNIMSCLCLEIDPWE